MRAGPRFAAPAERTPIDRRSLAEVFAASALLRSRRPVGPHRLLRVRLGPGRHPRLGGRHRLAQHPAHQRPLPRLREPRSALRNTGTDAAPVFERPRLITEGDGTPIDLGHHKCATRCHDLDGDGAPELICGSEDGKVYARRRAYLRWDWDCAPRFATGPITTTSGYGVVISVDPARTGYRESR